MARGRVKTYVKGFDSGVLRGGIPTGQVVLLRGPTGTMKSSLAYYVLYHNALHGTPGLYVTLEQDAASLLEHTASLGLRSTEVSETLPILDLSRGREHLEELASKMEELAAPTSAGDDALLTVLQGKILDLRSRFHFGLLAIDSWDALALILDLQDRREDTFAFFEWLRTLGVTSVLVAEVDPNAVADLEAFDEAFLADAIIQLRMEGVSETAFQRRIQCLKMRSADHDSAPYTLVFENGRFEIAKAIG